MAKVVFSLDGMDTIIQCNNQDTIKEIGRRYLSKIEKDSNDVYFVYNGEKINDEQLTFQELINNTDKKRNEINILVNEIDKNELNKYLRKSKDIICPNCGENILINIKEYKIFLHDCKNNHNFNNILINEFENSQKIDISKVICDDCHQKSQSEVYNNTFYRCCTCGFNLCPLCKSSHEKNSHKIINYEKKNYICEKHIDTYIKYCTKCKKNLCLLCEKEHNDHEIINLNEIIPDKEEITKDMYLFREKIDEFNLNIKDIIKKLNNLMNNIEIYYKTVNEIINNFEIQNRNYQILQDINEFINYNKTIKNDIEEIINEKNINNKFKMLLSIYAKLTNDYYLKVNHEFVKEPQNLKYNYDITNTNSYYGINDIFEVFLSYKDSKEYLISPNFDNNNLDIFSLLENKKIKSLQGHSNKITFVRYFINNKTYDEYLISAETNDNNKKNMVIIWDISNNYDIKYKIDTNCNNSIYSCLLLFPYNNINNFIVISTCSISKDIDKSATKIYLLNNCNFVKYIKNSNNEYIYYLLSWYNKINDKYYIIQLAKNKIRIDNLLEDELYYELKENNDIQSTSGYIFSNENVDYLCYSSNNGYIGIWDLFKKKNFKVININKCCLYHIIEWNSKYTLVADFYNKSFKVIDIEEGKMIKDIKGQHNDYVKCIKKIYHPNYGESLLSSSRDKTIKLWII